MRANRICMLVMMGSVGLAAAPGLAEARVVVKGGWETVTAASMPSGWSRQTIRVPGNSTGSEQAIVNGRFAITFAVPKDGSETYVLLASNTPSPVSRAVGSRANVFHPSFPPRLDALAAARGTDPDAPPRHVVALGEGAWGVIDDTLPETPVIEVVRQISDGLVIASTQPRVRVESNDPGWGAADAALRVLAGKMDGFRGPDPARLNTSSNAVGLAALSAAWRASRGTTRFTITRVVTTSPKAPVKTVVFHDQGRRVHGAGFALRAPIGAPLGVPLPTQARFRIRDVFRQGRFFSWEQFRVPGGCYYRSSRRFPAHMRFVKLFADDLINERGEDGSALAWPDGSPRSLGQFLPPTLILDPERVRNAYALVFKPLRVIRGKTRIEYLWTGVADRLHLVVRVSRRRIEAIRTERLDQTGRVVGSQSIRIAYSVAPALTAASPTCRR